MTSSRIAIFPSKFYYGVQEYAVVFNNTARNCQKNLVQNLPDHLGLANSKIMFGNMIFISNYGFWMTWIEFLFQIPKFMFIMPCNWIESKFFWLSKHVICKNLEFQMNSKFPNKSQWSLNNAREKDYVYTTLLI